MLIARLSKAKQCIPLSAKAITIKSSQSKERRKTEPMPNKNQMKAGMMRPTQNTATSMELELSPVSLLSYFHSVAPSSRTSLHLKTRRGWS